MCMYRNCSVSYSTYNVVVCACVCFGFSVSHSLLVHFKRSFIYLTFLLFIVLRSFALDFLCFSSFFLCVYSFVLYRTISYYFSCSCSFPSRIVCAIAVAIWLMGLSTRYSVRHSFFALLFFEKYHQINFKGSIISHCGMGTSEKKTVLFWKIMKLFCLKMCNLVEIVTHFGSWCCCCRRRLHSIYH